MALSSFPLLKSEKKGERIEEKEVNIFLSVCWIVLKDR